MNKILDEYLMELKQDNRFHQLMEILKERRPRVPLYDYRNENTEEVKYEGSAQRGFDMACKVFNITFD